MGQVVPFPAPKRFVAITGGPALYIVAYAIGEAFDPSRQAATAAALSLADAQRIARELAAPEGLEVRLDCYSGHDGSGAAA